MAQSHASASLVALTGDAIDESEHSASFVVGNRVRTKAASRSAMLSALRSTHGMAQLPGGISPDEFALWQTACIVHMDLPPDQLATVLKVCQAAAHPTPAQQHPFTDALSDSPCLMRTFRAVLLLSESCTYRGYHHGNITQY